MLLNETRLTETGIWAVIEDEQREIIDNHVNDDLLWQGVAELTISGGVLSDFARNLTLKYVGKSDGSMHQSDRSSHQSVRSSTVNPIPVWQFWRRQERLEQEQLEKEQLAQAQVAQAQSVEEQPVWSYDDWLSIHVEIARFLRSVAYMRRAELLAPRFVKQHGQGNPDACRSDISEIGIWALLNEERRDAMDTIINDDFIGLPVEEDRLNFKSEIEHEILDKLVADSRLNTKERREIVSQNQARLLERLIFNFVYTFYELRVAEALTILRYERHLKEKSDETE